MGEGKRDRRGGLIGPLILIGLGVVFLLNNLGILDWSIWEILLRLWPVLLVAAGLDLILGRLSVWGSLLALVLTLAVLVVALWLSQTGVGVGRAARTQDIVQPLENVSQAEVVIDPGVGTIRVNASADSENLAEGTLNLGRGEELERSHSVEDGTGILTLRTQRTSFGPSAVGWTGGRVWHLELTAEVPLHLETDLGLGQTDLDLTGLTVERLNVDHGLGQTIVVLPDEGRFEATIQGAIGQTIVVIPESLEVRLRLDTGITGREIPPGYVCEDDLCTSPGYETADQRVDLTVGQAIGSLVIRH